MVRRNDMEEVQDSKIWKYMDLAKFVSLLTTKSLYFSCPSQFDDPFEGSVPRSHAKAESEMIQRFVDDLLSLRPHFAAQSSASLQKFDDLMQKFQGGDTAFPKKGGLAVWSELLAHE